MHANRATKRGFTLVGSDLTQKNLTRLEKLARDKHSSLLGALIMYDRKKSFITLVTSYPLLPGPCVIKLFVCNLLLWVIS